MKHSCTNELCQLFCIGGLLGPLEPFLVVMRFPAFVSGTIYLGSKPRYTYKMTPTDSPTASEYFETELDCARFCLTSTTCQAYAVERQSASGPTAILCHVYDVISGTHEDAKSTTYMVDGNRIPTV